MGMSSSQARLLQLTAQMHNIEFKAQTLENQKLALATQEDAIYNDYCDALDATKLQVSFYNGTSIKGVDATFSTMCDFTDGDRCADYMLTNAKSGKVYVAQNVAEAYENFGNDRYNFAWAALGFDAGIGEGEYCGDMCWYSDGTTPETQGLGGDGNLDKVGAYVGIGDLSQNGEDIYMTGVEEYVYRQHSDDAKLVQLYDNIDLETETDDKEAALETFREYLYTNYAEEIFEQITYSKNDFPGNTDVVPEYEDLEWSELKDKFDYYLSLYDAIKEAGGCEALEEKYQSGEAGAKWLKNMTEAGLVTVQVLNTSGVSKGWKTTSAATDKYFNEVEDDTNVKKAEIEYEYQMDLINNKDTRIDNELNELETERDAIKTEMDSLKTVRDENIEKTFSIFS